MPKVKLTKTFIRKITPPNNSARVDYFDEDVTGLVLEVRKSGNKTYYFHYTENKKSARVK